MIDRPLIKTNSQTTLIDFFLPIVIMIASIILSMLYSGNWCYFGGSNNIVQALQHSSAAIALFLGGIVALLISITLLLLRRRISLAELPSIAWEGINLMLPAVVILLLAWTFGYILRTHLHTGEYLAQLLISSVHIGLLPALLFITAALIAFTVGTAWGTAAMLFPIAIPMVPVMLGLDHIPTLAEVPVLVPVLGAILSGCVAGNHISPIADTTIMSASSTRTPVMEHVRTQLPYAIPVIFATSCGFILAARLISYGYLIAWIVPVIASAAISIGIMHALHAYYRRK